MGNENNHKKDFINLCINRDRKFLTLDDKEREKIVDGAISCGISAAKEIRDEHETNDPRKIVQNIGIVVRGVNGGVKEDFIIRSEYRSKDKEIVIYRDSLNIMMRKALEEADAVDTPMKILIAHELFHYLEQEKLGPMPEKFALKRWKVGPFEHKTKIKSLSEVGAHAFAQALLDVSYSPLDF